MGKFCGETPCWERASVSHCVSKNKTWPRRQRKTQQKQQCFPFSLCFLEMKERNNGGFKGRVHWNAQQLQGFLNALDVNTRPSMRPTLSYNLDPNVHVNAVAEPVAEQVVYRNKHPLPDVVSFTRVPVPCARSMKRDRAHMDLSIKKYWVKLIYVNGGRRFRIPWDLAFHYFFPPSSFHLPWHFDIIASFKSTISSAEPKTHNGAWHLWRSTSCSIEEKWGGVMKRGGNKTKGRDAEIWFFSSRGRQAVFKYGGWNVTGGKKQLQVEFWAMWNCRIN